jgi:predicted GNAT family N-acyltransferase
MQPLTIQIQNYTVARDAIQAVRSQVFQIEQGIDPTLDFDGLDPAAVHILALWEDQAIGTARIRYFSGHTAKVERLAVIPEFRHRGIGQCLMNAILTLLASGDVKTVVLHAQEQTVPFYEHLGFKPVGDRFWEANIPHLKMQKMLALS